MYYTVDLVCINFICLFALSQMCLVDLKAEVQDVGRTCCLDFVRSPFPGSF